MTEIVKIDKFYIITQKLVLQVQEISQIFSECSAPGLFFTEKNLWDDIIPSWVLKLYFGNEKRKYLTMTSSK